MIGARALGSMPPVPPSAVSTIPAPAVLKRNQTRFRLWVEIIPGQRPAAQRLPVPPPAASAMPAPAVLRPRQIRSPLWTTIGARAPGQMPPAPPLAASAIPAPAVLSPDQTPFPSWLRTTPGQRRSAHLPPVPLLVPLPMTVLFVMLQRRTRFRLWATTGRRAHGKSQPASPLAASVIPAPAVLSPDQTPSPSWLRITPGQKPTAQTLPVPLPVPLPMTVLSVMPRKRIPSLRWTTIGRRAHGKSQPAPPPVLLHAPAPAAASPSLRTSPLWEQATPGRRAPE